VIARVFGHITYDNSHPRRRYDDVWVSLRSVPETPAMRAVVHRPGGFAFDLLESDTVTMPSPEHIRELQRDYERELATAHELSLDGIPAGPIDNGKLRDMGRKVAALLPHSVRREIAAALFRARHARRGLRLTLEVTAQTRDLLGVPWEIMALPLARGVQRESDAGETFLLLNADVTLVRQVEGVGRNTAPRLAPPLTLQVFAATPSGERPIDVDATREAVARVVAPDAVERYWHHGNGTLRLLQEHLRNSNPQVAHFLCHGQRRQTLTGPRYDLSLTRDDGGVRATSAFDLWPIFTLARDLQLVVLQACYSGESGIVPGQPGRSQVLDEREAVESIALTLIRQGMPAVVAMQGAVGQHAAGDFVSAMYGILRAGGTLEEAIGAGRVAMYEGGGIVDWGLPVIYQGSGRPEPEAWYTRLADRIESSLYDPSTLRALRGGVVAMTLLLLTSAAARAVLAPGEPVSTEQLVAPLALWVSVGVVCPAVIAATHRGLRNRRDLSEVDRRRALYAQWVGAYTAFTLSAAFGLSALITLWTSGVLGLLAPAAQYAIFLAVLVSALMLSYTGARSQARIVAMATRTERLTYNWRTLGIVLLGMAMLLAAPLLLLLEGGVLELLRTPAPVALALGIMLLSLVLAVRR
jgi:hypothetical protein